MKKTISIILLSIFVLLLNAYAAEYRVEWFDLDGDYNVYYSDGGHLQVCCHSAA